MARWSGLLLADAVHALPRRAAGRGHPAGSADAFNEAAGPTAAGAFRADGAADVAWEAGPLALAARVAWAAHFASQAADTLASAELIGLTALAVSRSTYGAALAGAIDLAATAILDDLVTFPVTELASGFRMALPVLLLVMVVMIGVMVSTPTATADDGPIAAARAPGDRLGGERGDVAERGGERGDQTAQDQPARGGRGQRFRESVKAIRVHPRSRAAHAVRHRWGKNESANCRGTLPAA